MRTCVVQYMTGEQDPHMLRSFYQPCMRSVYEWAKARGYEYKLYTSVPEEMKRDWNSDLGVDFYDLAHMVFDKLMLCDQPDYDRVMWVDNDIYAWGDPEIDKSWFCIAWEEKMRLYQDWRFPFPQSGIFWGMDGVKDFIEWYKYQINNPQDRDDRFQFILLAHKFGWTENFNDQFLMSPWYYDNSWRIKNMGLKGAATVHRRFNPVNMEEITPNSFVHFTNTFEGHYSDRISRFKYFTAYRLYWERYVQAAS